MASRKEEKVNTCQVAKCSSPSERSVSAKKVKDSGLDVDTERGKVHLCKEHYRDFKKKTKDQRKLDRMGW
ncbi:MAG: hypothetical protein ACMUIE_08390 [Thermoplasmatota archaeon]